MKTIIILITFGLLAVTAGATTINTTNSTATFSSNYDGPGFNYKKHGKKSKKIKRKNRKKGTCPYAYGG